jgi:hypothetical protein
VGCWGLSRSRKVWGRWFWRRFFAERWGNVEVGEVVLFSLFVSSAVLGGDAIVVAR